MRTLLLRVAAAASLAFGPAAFAWDVEHDEVVKPLAILDNGEKRFCVAARRGNVTWLPVYLLSPFLFCEETKLDFGALRLDSFAEKVLMESLLDCRK